jgi:hypothetical protein
MTDDIEKIPLDARLLSYAIIELNISRRNVAIYPGDHPSVKNSLSTAFKFLKQLFNIRPQITLAVAKDTIIIDKYHLDKKNPVFRDFALTLSNMNIAHITLKTGITKDELYGFHRFITEKLDDLTIENIKKVINKYTLPHIDIGFIDYQKFSTKDFSPGKHASKVPLWERYIYGLVEGTLQNGSVTEEIREIPPEILAQLLNKVSNQGLKEEAYDKVITTYLRNSSESIFSGRDLKRLLEFIERLRPDLKKRFLSSAVNTFSSDTASTYESFKKISADEIEGFLDAVNTQRLAIPPALLSLMDKFSYNAPDPSDAIYIDEDLIDDEEFLPSNLAGLFDEKKQEEVLQRDIREIQDLVSFDASELKTSHLIDFDNEFNEDLMEKRSNQIILNLMSSDIISEENYRSFADVIKEQSRQLLWIGHYEQVLQGLQILEANVKRNYFSDISSKTLGYFRSAEFILQLVDSFLLLGRQMKNEVLKVCEYYDREIIPYLIDALIKEESQTTRRFLMNLLKGFGNKIIPEAVTRLNDSRWFVKRNMLYILMDLDTKEVSEYIKPCCHDENPKVRITALRCLLNLRDEYAIATIRQNLASSSEGLFVQAVTLAGSFKLNEVVDDLISLLNKHELTGADILHKISIVRALGDIADPKALKTLRRLLSSRSILFRKTSDQLKEDIYKTLKNYPYDLVKDLVDSGAKSKNRVIREESLRVRNENES